MSTEIIAHELGRIADSLAELVSLLKEREVPEIATSEDACDHEWQPLLNNVLFHKQCNKCGLVQ